MYFNKIAYISYKFIVCKKTRLKKSKKIIKKAEFDNATHKKTILDNLFNTLPASLFILVLGKYGIIWKPLDERVVNDRRK